MDIRSLSLYKVFNIPIHSLQEARPHVCSYCASAFKRNSHLQRHIANLHDANGGGITTHDPDSTAHSPVDTKVRIEIDEEIEDECIADSAGGDNTDYSYDATTTETYIEQQIDEALNKL